MTEEAEPVQTTTVLEKLQAELTKVPVKADFFIALKTLISVAPDAVHETADTAARKAWNAAIDWMSETGLVVIRNQNVCSWHGDMSCMSLERRSSFQICYAFVDTCSSAWELSVLRGGPNETVKLPFWMLPGFVKLGFTIKGRALCADDVLSAPVFEEVVAAMTDAAKSALVAVAWKELAKVNDPVIRKKYTRRVRYIDRYIDKLLWAWLGAVWSASKC